MKEHGGTEVRSERTPWGALLLVVLFAAPGLFARGPLPPDETRYADVALAMGESGEWLVPRLHQKWYFEKPPVFFWTIAALHGLGAPIGAAPRLVTLLAALGTIACLPALARAFGLEPGSARRGGLVLATLPLFTIYAQLGYVDQLLGLELALAALCALRRGATPRGLLAARAGWAAAEGGLLGVALLTKGPVALLFAAGLRAGAARARRPQPGNGTPGGRAPGAPARLDLLVLLAAAAIAGAWLLAAAAHAGSDFVWKITIGQLERRVAGIEAKHQAPPGFLAAIVLVGGLPWSLLALGRGAAGSWRDALRPAPRLAGLVGWGALPVVALACLPTQQPHYALPSLAPLALLTGEALRAPVGRTTRRLAAGLGLLAGGALVSTGLALPWLAGALRLDAAIERQVAQDRMLAAAAVLAGLGVLAAVAWRTSGRPANPPLRALAAVTAFCLALPIVAWRLDDLMSARSLVEAPALAGARRIVAPTALRSAIRIRTRHPLVEEYDGRDPERMLAGDPGLVVVDWRKALERSGLLGRAHVVARGGLRGRELVALQGALLPPPERRP